MKKTARELFKILIENGVMDKSGYIYCIKRKITFNTYIFKLRELSTVVRDRVLLDIVFNFPSVGIEDLKDVKTIFDVIDIIRTSEA